MAKRENKSATTAAGASTKTPVNAVNKVSKVHPTQAAPAAPTLAQVAAAVDALAPFRLAYDWDNVGLQVGDPARAVTGVVMGLEVSPEMIAAAEAASANVLLTHHPLIFQPAKSLRGDTVTGRLLLSLVERGIGLVAAHTNLDRVRLGTNDILADKMELRDRAILEPTEFVETVKLVVFVPRTHTDKLVEAIHRGGGGRIGHYSHCTFRAPGTGTFLPGAEASPFQGTYGVLEHADEDRLEAVVPKRALARVLAEVRGAHPYEEIALDVYPLAESDARYGLGVSGTLPREATLGALARTLAKAVGEKHAQVIGDVSAPVRRVAVISGSAGGSVRTLDPARFDVLVTGELGYHLACEARDRGLRVILIGHAASERIFAEPTAALLRAQLAKSNLVTPVIAFEKFPEPAQIVTVKNA